MTRHKFYFTVAGTIEIDDTTKFNEVKTFVEESFQKDLIAGVKVDSTHVDVKMEPEIEDEKSEYERRTC